MIYIHRQCFNVFYWQKYTKFLHILLIFAPRPQHLFLAGIRTAEPRDNDAKLSCIIVVLVLNAEKLVDNSILWYSDISAWWVAWWRHQMETFSALLAICVGNSPVSGPFMFSLICARINGWVNICGAGDLTRIRPHYYVTVMVETIPLRRMVVYTLEMRWK